MLCSSRNKGWIIFLFSSKEIFYFYSYFTLPNPVLFLIIVHISSLLKLILILIFNFDTKFNEMDEPQPCSRCKKIPEDILMLSCTHDLCLQCAADRLSVELKKKKIADVNFYQTWKSIECEICS